MLAVHPGSLGDVVLSIPALASVRARFPRHRLALLAQAEIATLLQTCGVVDRVLATESGDLACLMGGTDHVPSALEQLLHSCDYVCGWLHDSGGVLATTLRRFGISQVSLRPPTACNGTHQSDRYLEVVGEKLNDGSGARPLIIPKDVRDSGRRALQAAGISHRHDVVVFHPGSGSPHKCIPVSTLAAVIENVQRTGGRPVLVGGPADDQRVERVRELSAGIPVITGQNLMTVAGILASCRLFVGHDSGLTHLAGAMHLPTVAMFGPTDPRQWRPLGEHVAVVTGPACSCATWEHVRACVTKSCLSLSADTLTEACHSLLCRSRSVTKS